MNLGFSLLTLFPGRVGGSETYVQGLLGEFARGRGPERVTVLANRHVMAAYRDHVGGPVALRPVPSFRAGARAPTRALAIGMARLWPSLAARAVPPGIEVMHYPVTVPIPDSAVPRVVTLHDVQHLEMPRFFSRAERVHRRWAYDDAARSATAVITVSAHARERISELLGIDRERVRAIPHGVDHGRFHPGPGAGDADVLEALGVPERFVMYPGNLWPHKNHRALVEALAGVPGEVDLVLTGEDYGRRGELLAHAERAGVGRRVHHLGFVPRDALPALYRSALALVYPSLYEGFGAPLLEAMACGCPVAASDRPALTELGADAMLAFDPESAEAISDAIERVVSDEDLRGRLRRRGPERAAGFTWRAAAAAHVDVYGLAATCQG
jgi:glycosyltransferase involved in cell wall biosynthesis